MKKSILLALLIFSNHITAHDEVTDYLCKEERPRDHWVGSYSLGFDYMSQDKPRVETRSDTRGVNASMNIDCYKLMGNKELFFTWKAKLFYKKEDSKIGDAIELTKSLGLEVADIKYKGFDHITPFFSIGFTKIEQTDQKGKIDFDATSYTLGLSYDITESFTFTVKHSRSYDDLVDKLVEKSTVFGLEYTWKT